MLRIENLSKNMKEENYTIKSELDAKVFKVITRCLKENGTLSRHKFGNILKACYDSRKGHPSEDMLFNISYWLDDAQLHLKPHLRLMYYVYISNLIDGKELAAKTNFLKRFESQLTDLTSNALNGRSFDNFYDVFNAHYDAIHKAFSILYSEETANDKIDCISLIFNGIQKNIPF